MRGKLTDQQMKERMARRNARKKASNTLISITRVPTRKEMRSIAKTQLRRAEYTKINKKDSNGKSFFSKHWREWAFKKIKMPKRRSA